MVTHCSRFATGLLVVAAVVLTAGRASAVFYPLGPSKEEWGLKYDVQLTPAAGDKINVVFTLTDEGRLRPVHSFTVVAFSLRTDGQGGRSFDVKAPLELKPTADGKRSAQVQIGKQFADRAMIRVLTLSVDGRRQTAGAAYYDIPLKKFLTRTPTIASRPTPSPTAATSTAAPSTAASPTPKVAK